MVTDDEFAADRARRVATVAFDLDGALVDTMGYAPQVYANTIRRLGGPGVTPKKVVDVRHIGPTAAFLRHFLRRDVSEAGIDVYFEIFDEAFAETRAFPGVIAMLDNLAGLGFPVGILTTATRRAANTMLRAGEQARVTSTSSWRATTEHHRSPTRKRSCAYLTASTSSLPTLRMSMTMRSTFDARIGACSSRVGGLGTQRSRGPYPPRHC